MQRIPTTRNADNLSSLDPVRPEAERLETEKVVAPFAEGMQPPSPTLSSAALGNARAFIVNRTHRVVRERAFAMHARKRKVRTLAVPMAICSALLLIVCHAVWTTISQNSFGLGELNAVGEELEETAGRLLSGQAMDSGGPVYILLMWFLPVSLVAIATLLMRRAHGRYDDEVTR